MRVANPSQLREYKNPLFQRNNPHSIEQISRNCGKTKFYEGVPASPKCNIVDPGDIKTKITKTKKAIRETTLDNRKFTKANNILSNKLRVQNKNNERRLRKLLFLSLRCLSHPHSHLVESSLEPIVNETIEEVSRSGTELASMQTGLSEFLAFSHQLPSSADEQHKILDSWIDNQLNRCDCSDDQNLIQGAKPCAIIKDKEQKCSATKFLLELHSNPPPQDQLVLGSERTCAMSLEPTQEDTRELMLNSSVLEQGDRKVAQELPDHELPDNLSFIFVNLED